jgi:hypothetical protein
MRLLLRASSGNVSMDYDCAWSDGKKASFASSSCSGMDQDLDMIPHPLVCILMQPQCAEEWRGVQSDLALCLHHTSPCESSKSRRSNTPFKHLRWRPQHGLGHHLHMRPILSRSTASYGTCRQQHKVFTTTIRDLARAWPQYSLHTASPNKEFRPAVMGVHDTMKIV